jgi:hypothetical protein
LPDPGFILEPQRDALVGMRLCCRLRIALRVHGPGLLLGQAETAHDARHRLRAHRLAEPRLDEAAQVAERPTRRLAALWVRAAQDMVD